MSHPPPKIFRPSTVLPIPFYFISFRNYTGPTNQGLNEGRSRNYGSRGQYSPVIEIDEDSHSKFINETSQGGGRSGRGTSVGPGGIFFKKFLEIVFLFLVKIR